MLETSQDGQARLARATARMEQYRSIIANSVKPEAVAAPPVPPPDVHWPRGDEVVGDDSGGEVTDALPSGPSLPQQVV